MDKDKGTFKINIKNKDSQNEESNLESETKSAEEITDKKTKRKIKRPKKKTIAIAGALLALLILIPFPGGKYQSYAKAMTFLKNLFSSKTEIVEIDSNPDNYETYEPEIVPKDNSDAVETGGLSTISQQERQEALDAMTEESRVYCVISSSPYFPSSDMQGGFFISNPEESVFHMQVVIEESKTGREMYTSPLLAPNEKIEYDYLSESFPNGEYPAMAYFNYYQKDDEKDSGHTYKGTVSVEINIRIGN